MALNTQPNLARPDDFYEALIDMHRDLDDAQSQSANAQMILLLANHIGDHATLLEAMRHAREGVTDVAAQGAQTHSLAA
ncbi:hypothetical protein R70006_06928 [Paraburkholderia domus]|uniref:DUF2783 domain-containing protein n=1 Tax=Paraburkholderia domus TaxID=2793075 RepID=UPI0019142D8E|nr:DUF2783 domain-containing protein [Paraburkholderia domus]MBK5053589.1 DUF2783 domain-containing protein [Burkholderia sp. R-70006]CAE6837134.1 hypothetical protein R70006_06928 [Paraburkholderia domus]